MLIAQISDTHIVAIGEKTYGVAPTDQALLQCISHINQLNPLPDLVLVTGDITNSGKEEECEHALILLNQLKPPYYVIPGNHDDTLNVSKTFKTPLYFAPNAIDNDASLNGFMNYVIDDYDVRLVAIDSTAFNQPGGEFCKARATWLQECLAKEPEKPTIIFMHHPPLPLSILESNHDGFIGAEMLGSIIKKYSNIERIVCGHVHRTTFSQWSGTIVSTAPSVGMTLRLDLTMTLESQFSLQDPAYHLHHWTAEKNLISHAIHVTETKQYLFKEHE